MKVNLGCGSAYIPDWVNVDASEDVRADIHLDARSFIHLHGHDTRELYMGHFLEHLMPADALELLRSVVESLPEGAEVSAVAPDIRQVFRAYQAGSLGNRELNEWYIYSYIQPSHHLWCHDEFSLVELFTQAGFLDVATIDPSTWPPVWHKEGSGARFQCGVRGTVPAAGTSLPELTGTEYVVESFADAGDSSPVETAPSSADSARVEELQQQVNRLLDMFVVEAELRNAAEVEVDRVRRSRTFRLAVMIRRVGRKLLPAGSESARVARSLMRRRRSVSVEADRHR
jgi:predicted SAM-dependent methyltransferase